MPSVINMKEADARSAILGAAQNAQIKVVSRKDSGKEGIVLEQDPRVGASISGTVTLTVSAGNPAVPDVKGQTFGTAKSTLETAGFTVKENPVADPTATDGTVIGQTPAAGERNAAEVTLDVARKDAATYLVDLVAIESKSIQVSKNAAATNGVEYARAITLTPYSRGEQASISYNLGRGYRQFDAVIGVSDLASADTRATVDIQAEDGRSLYNAADLVLGQPVTAKVDVTNVLRLTIVVTATAGSDPDIVFGDPRLSNPR